MTNEEAITYVNCLKNNYTINTAIKAFLNELPSVTPSYNSIKTELKSCEDCISRQAVLDLIVANHTELNGVNVVMYSPLYKDIKQLPSVTPQPKTGHWILADEQNKDDIENDNYLFICSECQCSDIHAKGTKVPYCWKCGAKMDESEL